MRGQTLQCALIALLLLKVLILRGMLADQGSIRGKTPHYTPIALLLKIRGNTHRLYGGQSNAEILSAPTNRERCG